MGHKTRSNYKIPLCLKDCANRDKECKSCIRFSNYEPNNP